MYGTQVVQSIGVLPFRDVYDLVRFIIFSSVSIVFALYLYHLISLLIGSRGRLKDTFVNDKRALSLVATNIVTTIAVYEYVDPYMPYSSCKLDVSIYLIYMVFPLTRQVLTPATRNRREAELTAMKRMVASLSADMIWQWCLQMQLRHGSTSICSTCFILGWSACLILAFRTLRPHLSVQYNRSSWDWEEVRFPCFRRNRRKPNSLEV